MNRLVSAILALSLIAAPALADFSWISSGSGGRKYTITLSGTGFKGAYSAGTTYAQNDVVLYSDGNNYVSLTEANTDHTPSSSASWWQPVTLTGPAGPQGPAGADGAGVSVGTDGTYGWNTSTNTSTYTDCAAGKYGFNWIAGVLYQCVNGTNSVFGGGSTTYPGAGIAVSTGSAWSTSLPAPPGGTTSYLRADGTWATPQAGGGSGGAAETVATYGGDTTIRNGNYYLGQAKAKLTFRNHSSGMTRIFANYTTTLKPDVATSKFRWVHPTTFANATTSAGYSVKVPPNTRVEVVSDGSGTFQMVPTQPPLKTGANEYPGGTVYASSATYTAGYALGSLSTRVYVGQLVNTGTYSLSRAVFNVESITGNVSAKSYTAQVYSRSGTSLNTLKGTSSAIVGIGTGAAVFDFPTPVSVTAGDVIVMTTGTYDTSNYVTLQYGGTSGDGGYSMMAVYSSSLTENISYATQDLVYAFYTP